MNTNSIERIEIRSDIQLVSRAVKERWPLDDSQRNAITKRLTEIALGTNARAATSASRVLASLDRLNAEGTQLENCSLEDLKDELRFRLQQKLAAEQNGTNLA